MSATEIPTLGSFNATSIAVECRSTVSFGHWGLGFWMSILFCITFLSIGCFLLGHIVANDGMNREFLRACSMQGARGEEEMRKVAYKWMRLGRNFEGAIRDIENRQE